MRRTLFYKKFTVNSIEELDFLYNSLSDFKMEYGVKYYRVDESDVPDPWLISYRCYGTVAFWWVLLVVNEIQNPLTEIEAGLVLTVPNVMDIYKFQRKYRVRRN